MISVLVSVLSAHALTWEKTAQDISVDAGARDLVAEFPFKNEGTAPVTIIKLKASCGCTTATVETRLVPTGGKGVLKAIYSPGDRIGPQSARITVMTDDPKSAPVDLQLRVNIQPLVVLTPRLVHWNKADGLVSRTIELKRLSKTTVRVGEPKAAGDHVAVEMKPGKEPDTWSLTLTPKSVEAPFTSKVEIPVTVGDRVVTYSAFAIVR